MSLLNDRQQRLMVVIRTGWRPDVCPTSHTLHGLPSARPSELHCLHIVIYLSRSNTARSAMHLHGASLHGRRIGHRTRSTLWSSLAGRDARNSGADKATAQPRGARKTIVAMPESSGYAS